MICIFEEGLGVGAAKPEQKGPQDPRGGGQRAGWQRKGQWGVEGPRLIPGAVAQAPCESSAPSQLAGCGAAAGGSLVVAAVRLARPSM